MICQYLTRFVRIRQACARFDMNCVHFSTFGRDTTVWYVWILQRLDMIYQNLTGFVMIFQDLTRFDMTCQDSTNLCKI